ncbi:MAG: helix-turn-helix domain-containing protein [candidate division NC10 bacterium]|nr:helix-turn-helix domain-containing protein [candidate division NC10 bacterium]
MMTKLLRPEEAAARLLVSPLTIRKWIFARRLPVVKLGRSVRIREQDLEALINFGYQPLQRGR